MDNNLTLNENSEYWVVINGYPKYFVSNFGRVMNIKTKRILKPNGDDRGYYIVDLYKNGKKKHFRIHRLVGEAFCDNPENKPYIDHIDHNGFNNHYKNLRWVSSSENNRNKNLTSLNTSGFKGVSFDKYLKRWKATYSLNYKKKHIGYFQTKEECAIAYDKKMLEIDPEHSVLNFPIPKNQRNVYISYHTLKKHLEELKSIIDGFEKN